MELPLDVFGGRKASAAYVKQTVSEEAETESIHESLIKLLCILSDVILMAWRTEYVFRCTWEI